MFRPIWLEKTIKGLRTVFLPEERSACRKAHLTCSGRERWKNGKDKDSLCVIFMRVSVRQQGERP